jgi:hypothetical protein
MRWPPVTLTVGIWYLSTASAMRRSSSAVVSPPHMRGITAVGAVLLDVGVAALVDVAALWIVFRLLGPGAEQVVVDGRAAAGAAVGRLPFHELEHVADGQQLAALDGVAHRLVAVVGAAAHGLHLGGGGVVAAGGGHQQLLHQAGAGAAGRAGLGVLAHLVQREQAFFLDGLADSALGHAVAAADLVGHPPWRRPCCGLRGRRRRCWIRRTSACRGCRQSGGPRAAA